MGVKEWDCRCHISPPCDFCVDLTEDEVDALSAGGKEGLEAYWSAKDALEDEFISEVQGTES